MLNRCVRYNIRSCHWQQSIWYLLISTTLLSVCVGCAWRLKRSPVNRAIPPGTSVARKPAKVGGGGSQQSVSVNNTERAQQTSLYQNPPTITSRNIAPTTKPLSQMKHSNANGRSENPLHQEKPSPPLIRSNNSAMRQQSPTARSSDGFDPIKTYLKQLKRERKNGKGEYLISVGDLLDMTVRDAEELNEKMRVDEDGNVKLQFELGTVHAAGLSCSELTAKIKQVLVEKDYVRDPQVDIFVEEYGSLSIAVLGAVAKPGVYYLAERTIKFADVFDAAGGVVDEETSGQVYLYRQGEIDSSEAEDSNAARSGLGGYVKEPSRIKFDLSAILLGLEPSSSFPIKGGDVIVVGVMGRPIGGTDDAGRFFFIMGEVNEPGVFELARDTTVLQAITIAGGLTNVAKPSEIRVVRPVDNKALKLDLSKVAKGDQEDIWLEPEDIIIVPKNGSKAFALGFVDFWRSVFGVGVGIDYDANIGWNPSKRRLKAGTRR